jgi:hypothetical protein
MTRKLEFTIKAFIYSVPDGWPYFSFTYSLLVEKTATINEKFETVACNKGIAQTLLGAQNPELNLWLLRIKFGS